MKRSPSRQLDSPTDVHHFEMHVICHVTVVEFPKLLKIPLVPLASESLRRTPVPARQERIHSTRYVQEV